METRDVTAQGRPATEQTIVTHGVSRVQGRDQGGRPARRAGEVKLDGSLELSAVAALGIQGEPAKLLVSRDGKPLKLKIQPERAR